MVSVIMNTYNENRDVLSKAIESYLNQKNCKVELIISVIENDINTNFVKSRFKEVKIVETPFLEHPISTIGKCPLGSFIQLNKALKLEGWN